MHKSKSSTTICSKLLIFLQADINNARIATCIIFCARVTNHFYCLNIIAVDATQIGSKIFGIQFQHLTIHINLHPIFTFHADVVIVIYLYARTLLQQFHRIATRCIDAAFYVKYHFICLHLNHRFLGTCYGYFFQFVGSHRQRNSSRCVAISSSEVEYFGVLFGKAKCVVAK